jgi:hypothetical protein
MTVTEKVTAVAFAGLVILSLVAALSFVSLSVGSLLTQSLSRYWNGCFLVCAIALAGWMILYTCQLRLGGGVMIFRNNLLLFWFLVVAVVVSMSMRFASPQRYLAFLVFILILAAFHIAVPIMLNPRSLIRLVLKGHPFGSRKADNR